MGGEGETGKRGQPTSRVCCMSEHTSEPSRRHFFRKLARCDKVVVRCYGVTNPTSEPLPVGDDDAPITATV